MSGVQNIHEEGCEAAENERDAEEVEIKQWTQNNK
jgi:hypothetical protein